jgi:hypothetical protein
MCKTVLPQPRGHSNSQARPVRTCRTPRRLAGRGPGRGGGYPLLPRSPVSLPRSSARVRSGARASATRDRGARSTLMLTSPRFASSVKKMVGPAAKREGVAHLQAVMGLSDRGKSHADDDRRQSDRLDSLGRRHQHVGDRRLGLIGRQVVPVDGKVRRTGVTIFR